METYLDYYIYIDEYASQYVHMLLSHEWDNQQKLVVHFMDRGFLGRNIYDQLVSIINSIPWLAIIRLGHGDLQSKIPHHQDNKPTPVVTPFLLVASN